MNAELNMIYDDYETDMNDNGWNNKSRHDYDWCDEGMEYENIKWSQLMDP